MGTAMAAPTTTMAAPMTMSAPMTAMAAPTTTMAAPMTTSAPMTAMAAPMTTMAAPTTMGVQREMKMGIQMVPKVVGYGMMPPAETGYGMGTSYGSAPQGEWIHHHHHGHHHLGLP